MQCCSSVALGIAVQLIPSALCPPELCFIFQRVLITFILRSWTSSINTQHMYRFYGRAYCCQCSLKLVAGSCTAHFCKILSAVSLPANTLSQPDRHAIIQSAGIWSPFFCGVQFIKDAAQMFDASALFHTAAGSSRLGARLVRPVSCLLVAHCVFVGTILLPKSL